MLKIGIQLAIYFLIAGCDHHTETVFPDAKWVEAEPEHVGLESETLNEAVAFLERNSGGSGIHELMIIRRGILIYRGDSIDKVHGIWSCTKSFTSTVLGLLVDDSTVQLKTLAKDILPEMATSYPTATLSHFTTMTSGYKAVGDTATTGYTHGASATPFKPDTPLFEAGEKYAYWDAAMNQFSNILTHAAKEPLDEIFKRRIADPIGMNESAWYWKDFGEVDGVKVVGGAGNGSKGIYISANELARLGLLFLNGGNWNGKQLISRNWIQQATRMQVPASMEFGTPLSTADGMGVYGFNWWVNGIHLSGDRMWPNTPEGTYAASGYNNNKMFIIPEWDMVVVRLGLDSRDMAITDNIWDQFLKKIGDSIKIK